MINLYELQAKYHKMIYVSHKVLRTIEQEGSYWLELALNDYFTGIHHQKRFLTETCITEKGIENVIIKLWEENKK